jgi:hypothetical protein
LKNLGTKKYVFNGKDLDEAAENRQGRTSRAKSRPGYGYHSIKDEQVDENVLWKYSSNGHEEVINAVGPTVKEYQIMTYLVEKNREFVIDLSYYQARVKIFNRMNTFSFYLHYRYHYF